MVIAARVFLTFLCYSFLGWVCECIYCSVPKKKFINRGFLNGPLCPVYGFGALLVLTVLQPLSHSMILLFLGGFLLTSVLEYLTSFLLEKLFHMSWWDYSRYKFNLNGRVCLLNSTMFGVLSVIAVRIITPAVNGLVDRLNDFSAQLIALLLILILEADTIFSVHSVLALNGKLEILAQMKKELQTKTAEVQAMVLQKLNLQGEKRQEIETRVRVEVETLSNRVHALEENHRFPTRRLIEAFPYMQSVRDHEAIRRIRDAINAQKEKLKASRIAQKIRSK